MGREGRGGTPRKGGAQNCGVLRWGWGGARARGPPLGEGAAASVRAKRGGRGRAGAGCRPAAAPIN
jgi:hypothetical protein